MVHETSKLEAPGSILDGSATVVYKMYFDTLLQPTRCMLLHTASCIVVILHILQSLIEVQLFWGNCKDFLYALILIKSQEKEIRLELISENQYELYNEIKII